MRSQTVGLRGNLRSDEVESGLTARLKVNLRKMTPSTRPRLFDYVHAVRGMNLLFLLLIILVILAVAGSVAVSPLFLLLLVVALLLFLGFGRGGTRGM